MSTRPAYLVPTMREVNGVAWNGLVAVSTFSGCGGSSVGYRLAGYRVLWANEFVAAARESYLANAAPYTVVDDRDIRNVTGTDVLTAAGVPLGGIDVFDGSPPCASFAAAGKREAGWGKQRKYSDTVQRTDDLFFEYARLIRDTQPRTFVAENVAGLIRGTSKGYFIRILTALRACGYRVEARLLDAQWLGVPQARKRIIFIGVRNDLNIDPMFPTPLRYRYTLRDALTSPGTTTDPETGADISISRYAIGREWRRLTPGSYHRKYKDLIRPRIDRPAPTITATGGNIGAAAVTHPTELRKFTIAELRRVCGFPADFILTGTYEQRWERLGRAVPPIMMSHIATTIRDRISEQ